MKPEQPVDNQGEGDAASARRYDEEVRELVADGKVGPAAHEAAGYVQEHPGEARGTGPHAIVGSKLPWLSVDALVNALERLRPVVERTFNTIRSRLAKRY